MLNIIYCDIYDLYECRIVYYIINVIYYAIYHIVICDVYVWNYLNTTATMYDKCTRTDRQESRDLTFTGTWDQRGPATISILFTLLLPPEF